MGNLNEIAVSNSPTKRKHIPFESKRVQHLNLETNIIELSKKQKFSGNLDKSLGLKRVVFISLLGLYQTWKQCPSHILYSALFILPLKREWVYNPSKYVKEIQNYFFSEMNLFSDITEMNVFIQLLKWKDSQGLLLWALDHYQHPTAHDTLLIAPFWSHFSAHLSTLYDPVTRSKYNPLNLNINWWMHKSPTNNKYNAKTSSILAELYFVTMKYKTMQEIIYQSNPNSLCPIISWVNDAVCSVKRCYDINDIYNEFDNDDVQNWWISEDYNPYDLDQ